MHDATVGKEMFKSLIRPSSGWHFCYKKLVWSELSNWSQYWNSYGYWL